MRITMEMYCNRSVIKEVLSLCWSLTSIEKPDLDEVMEEGVQVRLTRELQLGSYVKVYEKYDDLYEISVNLIVFKDFPKLNDSFIDIFNDNIDNIYWIVHSTDIRMIEANSQSYYAKVGNEIKEVLNIPSLQSKYKGDNTLIFKDIYDVYYKYNHSWLSYYSATVSTLTILSEFSSGLLLDETRLDDTLVMNILNGTESMSEDIVGEDEVIMRIFFELGIDQENPSMFQYIHRGYLDDVSMFMSFYVPKDMEEELCNYILRYIDIIYYKDEDAVNGFISIINDSGKGNIYQRLCELRDKEVEVYLEVIELLDDELIKDYKDIIFDRELNKGRCS